MINKVRTRSQVYPSLDRCIYCESDGAPDGLRDEHIVPDALGGRLIIKKASCHDCEKETHAFEGRVISHLYGDTRAHIGMRRGKKRKWPEKFAVRTTRTTGPEEIEVSLDEHPGTMFAMKLTPSGIFLNHPPDDRDFSGVKLDMLSFDPDL